MRKDCRNYIDERHCKISWRLKCRRDCDDADIDIEKNRAMWQEK